MICRHMGPYHNHVRKWYNLVVCKLKFRDEMKYWLILEIYGSGIDYSIVLNNFALNDQADALSGQWSGTICNFMPALCELSN
jgi:hypothetical protein